MTRRPRVAFVVNGGPGSAMAERAGAFASRLGNRFDPHIVYRVGGRAAAAARMLRAIAAVRPDVCYVLDLAAAGVLAAGVFRQATGTPFVLDTGDAVVALGRALGRGPVGMWATRALEAYALRTAAGVVVRGTYHRELLAQWGVPAIVIPDGVEVDRFVPSEVGRVRTPVSEEESILTLGPGRGQDRDQHRPLTIGLVGSSVWVPARQTCYGWELVELVRLLRGRLPRPVRGVFVGNGSGLAVLRRRAAECGVADAIEFAGRLPYTDLPARLGGFDICLSTQTNDIIGNVRTTGKLPLYLAAGRFVLASAVGEAARLLPPAMLVPFAGVTDAGYPAKLADRVQSLVRTGVDFAHRPECVRIAREHFEYDRLAPRVADAISAVIGRCR